RPLRATMSYHSESRNLYRNLSAFPDFRRATGPPDGGVLRGYGAASSVCLDPRSADSRVACSRPREQAFQTWPAPGMGGPRPGPADVAPTTRPKPEPEARARPASHPGARGGRGHDRKAESPGDGGRSRRNGDGSIVGEAPVTRSATSSAVAGESCRPARRCPV